MRRLALIITLLLAAPLTAQTTVPFTIELKEVVVNNAPDLQAFAFAQWDGKWLVVGGRRAGLHGFDVPTRTNRVNNFPPGDFSRSIFVIDPVANQVWSESLGQLGPDVAPRLTVTNPAFEQSGDWLFVAGGFGFNPETKNMETFGSLTAIHVPSAIDAIMHKQPIHHYVEQIDDLRMRVTGGEMKRLGLGPWFAMVFGQNFEGLYTPKDSDVGVMFNQLYVEQVGIFKIATSPLKITDYQAPITAPPVGGTDPERTRPFHRRDLIVSPFVDVDGKQGVAAYGGVFLPGQIGAYRNPIYITATGATPSTPPTLAASPAKVTVDASYAQFMNLYDCPTLPMWSASSHTMYTTFFGGISAFYYDRTNHLQRDSGLPFVDSITTLVRNSKGVSSECVHSLAMPGSPKLLLGTNMAFIPAGDEVVKLDGISAKKLVGYLYGGIEATAPNKGTTFASNAIYAVWVNSKPSTCAHVPRAGDVE